MGGKNSGPWHQWSQKFFQFSRKNEKEKVKVINTEKWKDGKSIFVKIAKAVVIDSCYQLDLGCCQT